MRSTVQAVALFMNALSSALAQALVALAEDPLLVWNYGLVSVLAAAGGVLSWLDNRKLDREEDKLNLLPSAQFRAKMRVPSDEESGDRVVEEEGVSKRAASEGRLDVILPNEEKQWQGN